MCIHTPEKLHHLSGEMLAAWEPCRVSWESCRHAMHAWNTHKLHIESSCDGRSLPFLNVIKWMYCTVVMWLARKWCASTLGSKYFILWSPWFTCGLYASTQCPEHSAQQPVSNTAPSPGTPGREEWEPGAVGYCKLRLAAPWPQELPERGNLKQSVASEDSLPGVWRGI